VIGLHNTKTKRNDNCIFFIGLLSQFQEPSLGGASVIRTSEVGGVGLVVFITILIAQRLLERDRHGRTH
jgi:hypothetical protein